LKLYFAGNFPMMKDPEKEKACMEIIRARYPHYRRIISFFFEDDALNLINIKKELEE
jgi:hypothetical protein